MFRSKIIKTILQCNIVFILMFFICTRAHSSEATMEETLAWIKGKIETKALTFWQAGQYANSYKFKITYDTEHLTITLDKKTTGWSKGGIEYFFHQEIIPIKDIGECEIYSGDIHILAINTYNGTASIQSKWVAKFDRKGDGVDVRVQEGESMETSSSIDFSGSNKEIAQRVLEAFNHIAKLNGNTEPF